MRSPRDMAAGLVALIAETFARFDADGVPRLAAAMSYFLLLAVAPLLLIVNSVLGVVGASVESSIGGDALTGVGLSLIHI